MLEEEEESKVRNEWKSKREREKIKWPLQYNGYSRTMADLELWLHFSLSRQFVALVLIIIITIIS